MRRAEETGRTAVLHLSTTPRRSGFTMMELMLVVAISLIVAVLAVPRFARSYEGAKLRTAMRTVVMANRYARGLAVLNQKHTAILYDIGQAQGKLEIVSLSAPAGQAEQNRFLDARSEPAPFLDHGDDIDADAVRPAPSVNTEMTRSFPDGVRVIAVEVADESQEADGIYWVNYYPNGMCDKHSVQLMDSDEKTATVQVDPLSGRAKVIYEP